jgi:predicted flavoprotein YhiN
MTTQKQNISIIGGGAAGLFLACKLDSEKFNVTIYEKNTALARKFLVAGKGGFNLTHSENREKFIEKYLPQNKLREVFYSFDNNYFINWLKEIGVETFVGSSKRVFPKKGIKPIEVLNAIEKILKKNRVEIKFGHEWKGWDNLGNLVFEHKKELRHFDFAQCDIDLVVFALGGNSWKVTGSDGLWQSYFKEKGINTKQFQASNCAFKIEWKQEIIKKLEGKALKNVVFICGDKNASSLNSKHDAPLLKKNTTGNTPTLKQHTTKNTPTLNSVHDAPSLKLRRTRKGEAVITQFGIEGSGVYPFSNEVREGLNKNGKVELIVDLKPELTEEFIIEQLKNKTDLNIKTILESKINLSETAFYLIKLSTSKEEYNSPEFISHLIKNFPIIINGLAPIDEAISTVGGVPFDELNSDFELKKILNTYCIGEMVDWDAPTGGYLLQMCFSMGFWVGKILNDKF